MLVVGGAAVAAFDVLVVEDVVALLFHAGDHLAGVGGVDAVVTRGIEKLLTPRFILSPFHPELVRKWAKDMKVRSASPLVRLLAPLASAWASAGTISVYRMVQASDNHLASLDRGPVPYIGNHLMR